MVRVASGLFGLVSADIFDSSSSPLLFLNAHILDDISSCHTKNIVCEQGYRPIFCELRDSGYRVEKVLGDSVLDDSADSASDTPDYSGAEYSNAFVMIDRSRDYTRHLIRRAVMSVDEGGYIFVLGEKNYGIGSVRTWLKKNYTDDIESTPKSHCVLLRFCVTSSLRKKFDQTETDSNSGLFGLDVDRGSSLLAETFDSSITGLVGDFCSGTGFLGEELSRRSSPSHISFVEADYRALTYSRIHNESNYPCDYHWLDLTCESPPNRYDWIVMNPPFHRSRAAEPELGIRIIRTARSCLNPSGILRLVANRGLPYEDTLRTLFASVSELVVKDGYKVLEARVR